MSSMKYFTNLIKIKKKYTDEYASDSLTMLGNTEPRWVTDLGD